METAKKTLVLVFPPVTISTSPPLGLAMLKGYIERQLPEWDVKLLDLNLWVLNKFFAGIEAGTDKLSDSIYVQLGASREKLLEAVRVMRGKDNDIMLTQPDLYEKCGEIFARFCQFSTKMFEKDCAEFERTQKFPPGLR
jgi:anaerobic magnesium-protoporphyrin IX monomethyl ester cyclase